MLINGIAAQNNEPVMYVCMYLLLGSWYGRKPPAIIKKRHHYLEARQIDVEMAALHDITYLKAIHHRSGGFSESGLSSFIGSELHTKPISRVLYVTRVLALLAVRSDLAVQPRATVSVLGNKYLGLWFPLG